MMRGSNRISGKSKAILDRDGSIPIEELVKITTNRSRSVEDFYRRRDRKASINGGTNHKKSERPSRRSNMIDGINGKKLERPSRRSSMGDDTNRKKLERPSRRATMSDGVNRMTTVRPSGTPNMGDVKKRKKSERPSRRATMGDDTNHKKYERPSRRFSMGDDTNRKTSEHPNRRAAMSSGTKTGGDKDGDDGGRLISRNSTKKTPGRSFDEAQQQPRSVNCKQEDKLNLINLIVIVPLESSNSSRGSNFTMSDHTPLSYSMTSTTEPWPSRGSQSTGDRGSSKGRRSRSSSNVNRVSSIESFISRTLRKKREDRREETNTDIGKKDWRGKEIKKHTKVRRRNTMRL